MKNLLINLLGSMTGRRSTRSKGGAMQSMLLSVLSTAMVKRLIRR